MSAQKNPAAAPEAEAPAESINQAEVAILETATELAGWADEVRAQVAAAESYRDSMAAVVMPAKLLVSNLEQNGSTLLDNTAVKAAVEAAGEKAAQITAFVDAAAYIASTLGGADLDTIETTAMDAVAADLKATTSSPLMLRIAGLTADSEAIKLASNALAAFHDAEQRLNAYRLATGRVVPSQTGTAGPKAGPVGFQVRFTVPGHTKPHDSGTNPSAMYHQFREIARDSVKGSVADFKGGTANFNTIKAAVDAVLAANVTRETPWGVFSRIPA